MSSLTTAPPYSSFKLMLPDRMFCNVPFQGTVKYPLYKDPELYERYLNAAFLTANISEDRLCFMLEPGKDRKTLELVVPSLPSSTIGFKSPRTKRLLLFSALKMFSQNNLSLDNKRYEKEIKLLMAFMSANERSTSLNFEVQRHVDTILASNISVTEILESLIVEPRIRRFYVRVQGKSGMWYRLRICDTELALCNGDGNDGTIHVWPWQEVGEPKCAKAEIRMPWLIVDEQPQLTSVLADVLQSKRPENLNETKRRKLSRADSIPPPVVFDAKYHHTITVFAEDANSSSKLVYQIICVRAMALVNDTHPEPELISVQGLDSVETNQTSIGRKQKKKSRGLSLCGLNCMGTKEKDVEVDLNTHPSRRSLDFKQSRPSVTETVPPQDLQKVVEPSPPPRRRNSSAVKEVVVGEEGYDASKGGVESIPRGDPVTASPSGDLEARGESHGPVLDTSLLSVKNSESINLSRCPTYTKSDPVNQFLDEPQIRSICQSLNTHVKETGGVSSLESTSLASPYEFNETEVLQPPSTPVEHNKENNSGLVAQRDAEGMSISCNKLKTSPVTSQMKHEAIGTPSSPGRTSSTPHSGIPLPRNPTRALGSITRHSSSQSEEIAEDKSSSHLPEAVLERQASAADTAISFVGAAEAKREQSENKPLFVPLSPSVISNKPCTLVMEPNLDMRPEPTIDGCLAIANMIHSEALNQVSPTTSSSKEVVNTAAAATTTTTTTESPVNAASGTAPTEGDGAAKTDTPSSPVSFTSSQTRRTSGLMGPRVVVNKPGINVYKGRNAPSLLPVAKTGPEGDSPSGGATVPLKPYEKTPSSPQTAAVANVKPSNIRLPSVISEASAVRHQPRSSIPMRSPSATRNDQESPSTAHAPSVVTSRSAHTGIRVPSRLPRQTLAKVISLSESACTI